MMSTVDNRLLWANTDPVADRVKCLSAVSAATILNEDRLIRKGTYTSQERNGTSELPPKTLPYVFAVHFTGISRNTSYV
jgi:hypothetical protein